MEHESVAVAAASAAVAGVFGVITNPAWAFQWCGLPWAQDLEWPQPSEKAVM